MTPLTTVHIYRHVLALVYWPGFSVNVFTEALFKEKHGVMGPYAGVDHNSPCFIVNSVVSYPPPLKLWTFKVKGIFTDELLSELQEIPNLSDF